MSHQIGESNGNDENIDAVTPPSVLLVRAKYAFDGRNNDELNFRKNDIITVTQQIDGGWWEGTLNAKTGWFPSDYVTAVSDNDKYLRSTLPTAATTAASQASMLTSSSKFQYRVQVMKAFVDAESAHVDELNDLYRNYCIPLRSATFLTASEYSILVGNIEQIISQQTEMLEKLRKCSTASSWQQRIGGILLCLAPNMKILLRTYCENHPKAIEIINNKREELQTFISANNGLMKTFISGLSKPFRHLDKYPSTLQELERNMEDGHPDRGDVQRACSVYRDLEQYCKTIRKQKEMQMELLSTAIIREWDGNDCIGDLGEMIYMSTVSIDDNGKTDDRCLILFVAHLLLLEITPQINCYVLKKRIELSNKKILQRIESASSLQLFDGSNNNLLLTFSISNNDELNRWIDAFAQCGEQRVHIDDSCNVISPSVPQKYAVGHVMDSELSPMRRAEVCVLPTASSAMTDVLKKSSTLPGAVFDHELEMILPEPDDIETEYAKNNTLSSNGNAKQSPRYSGYCLRPFPPPRGNYAIDFGKKSTIKMRREVSSDDQEDAKILRVIESYCAASNKQSSSNIGYMHCSPQLIVAEDEKIFVEETVGDQVVVREKSLVDTVYALKDQISVMQKDLANMCKTLDREQRARRRLEELVRRNSIYSVPKPLQHVASVIE